MGGVSVRFFGTEEECTELIAQLNASLGYPRTYTQADIDSGLVVRHGGGRHTPVESLRTESVARVRAAEVDDDGNPVGNRRRVIAKRLQGANRAAVGRARLRRVINRGDATALVALPGIGAARAAAIIAHREAHGRFANLAELSDAGIPPRVIQGLRDEGATRIDDEDSADAPTVRVAAVAAIRRARNA